MVNADLLPQNKTILYAVLNWGLGHASRSIPVIRALIKKNNKVIIASDGFPLKYLREEFTDTEFKNLTSYNIRYPFNAISLNMIYNLPNILFAYYSEKSKMKNWISDYKVDLIISDHRLGCRSSLVKSILISHQQQPFHHRKWIKYVFKKVHYQFIKKFDEVWVPDDPLVNLSGQLSVLPQAVPPLYYLGIASRFVKTKMENKHLISAILSGPEPQRTQFENIVLKMFEKMPEFKKVLVRGTDEVLQPIENNHKLQIYNYLKSEDLQNLINQSSCILCRSGYSSLMDLISTNSKAIIIPTPGQSEQEYLASHNADKFKVIQESDLLDQIEEVRKIVS